MSYLLSTRKPSRRAATPPASASSSTPESKCVTLPPAPPEPTAAAETNAGRSKTFYIHPEFSLPKPTGDDVEACGWEWGGDETMHPFWAVRRLTAAQMRKLYDESKPGEIRPRFNCVLADFTMSNVTLAAPLATHVDSVLNVTRKVIVQYMTNCMAVQEGEELFIEVANKKPPDAKNKNSMRQALQGEQRARTASKRKRLAGGDEPRTSATGRGGANH